MATLIVKGGGGIEEGTPSGRQGMPHLRRNSGRPGNAHPHRAQENSWLRWLAVFALVQASLLHAQVIVAPSGRTLFSRSSLVRSFVEISRRSLEVDGQSVDSTEYITAAAVAYGFYPKWSLLVAQPYLFADIHRSNSFETQNESLNGFADGQVFLQYDGLYSRNAPGGLTRLSGLFGIQAPTGAQRFSTRAVEYTSGLVFEKAVRLKYVFTGDFEYTWATENRQGVSVGNQARFDAVPAYFVTPREKAPADALWMRRVFDRVFRHGAYFILEFNGMTQAHVSQHGRRTADSGGTTLAISPGIQYFLSNRLLAEFSAPLPVVRDLNGTQLRPDPSFIFGFRYLF